MPEWVHYFAYAVIALDILCALVVIVDLINGHAQKMWIMDLVWPITALYAGPLGLWAYFSIGRKSSKKAQEQKNHHKPEENEPQEHHSEKKHKKPFWQTVTVGTTHCGAGCTLGDFAAEMFVFLAGVQLFSSTLLTNYLFDYVLAFLAGIAFQYFSIVPMRNLSPGKGVIEALKADSLSLTAYELGMFGWMALTRFVLVPNNPPEPNQAIYWVNMQIAMLAGFLTSYPANWLLIRKGVKEAM